MDALSIGIWTITIYNTAICDTGKLNFVCSDATQKQFNFLNNNVNEVIGFDQGLSPIFTTLIVGIHVINMNRENSLYLLSNICLNNNTDNIWHNNVLSVVYTTGFNLFSYIVQQYDITQSYKAFQRMPIYNF